MIKVDSEGAAYFDKVVKSMIPATFKVAKEADIIIPAIMTDNILWLIFTFFNIYPFKLFQKGGEKKKD